MIDIFIPKTRKEFYSKEDKNAFISDFLQLFGNHGIEVRMQESSGDATHVLIGIEEMISEIKFEDNAKNDQYTGPHTTA